MKVKTGNAYLLAAAVICLSVTVAGCSVKKEEEKTSDVYKRQTIC